MQGFLSQTHGGAYYHADKGLQEITLRRTNPLRKYLRFLPVSEVLAALGSLGSTPWQHTGAGRLCLWLWQISTKLLVFHLAMSQQSFYLLMSPVCCNLQCVSVPAAKVHASCSLRG